MNGDNGHGRTIEGGWEGEGYFLPNGTIAKLSVHSRDVLATIDDGVWTFRNRRYLTPGGAYRGITGKTSNSFAAWAVKRPYDTKFVPLVAIRAEARLAALEAEEMHAPRC